ncbi:MAG: PepSY domain-containing protein, partial [Acidobacteria bacterium]|nr:PepSY domain-containing protein [Acidobacteriota bacterium]MDW7984624.1 PepSY domain-containing protein [Acidobacteriota bacterium]
MYVKSFFYGAPKGRWGLLAWALPWLLNFHPKPTLTPLDQKAFFLPELYISSENIPLEAVLDQLPNTAAWRAFLARHPGFYVYIDPRSGTPTNLIGPMPLIPGTGVGNRVTLATLSSQLGRPVEAVTPDVVAEQVLRFIQQHRDLFRIDLSQLGPPRVTQVTDYLWQVHIPQVVRGIPVRHGRVLATINHGNLVLIGTDTWGDVRIDVTPRISEDAALKAGFDYAGGRQSVDEIVEKPRLEIVPIAPPVWQKGEAFAGPIGHGYGHRLVWTWVFVRPPDWAHWEVMVDAHTGEVIAFQDINHYITKKIVGGVYPVTSTEVCPSPDKCGTLQSGWPMP